MAQSGIILNVQHQLEDILQNQNLIVQNQNEMFDKLNDIEKRLVNVETCLIIQTHQQHLFEQQQQQQHQQIQRPVLSTSSSSQISQLQNRGLIMPTSKSRLSTQSIPSCSSSSSQRLSLLQKSQHQINLRKRAPDEEDDGELGQIKPDSDQLADDKEKEEKQFTKRKKLAEQMDMEQQPDSSGEVEEGEIQTQSKNEQAGASSRQEEELNEDDDSVDSDDDDNQSTESSSTQNLSQSNKQSKSFASLSSITTPTHSHSSMPQSILQSLTSSSLLSSLQSLHSQLPQAQIQAASSDLAQLATDETGQVLINDNDIKRIFAMSKSRGNFAALLVQQMYGRHERIMSNVMGTRGKRQLSPRRMIVVKRLSFKMYPAANEREEETIWKKECVKAIDSKNRKVRITPGGASASNIGASQSLPSNLAAQPGGSSPLASLNRSALISRGIATRQQFSMSLNPLTNPGQFTNPHLTRATTQAAASASSANAVAAMAAAMAAAAAAAVASSNPQSNTQTTGSRSPNKTDKYNDYANT